MSVGPDDAFDLDLATASLLADGNDIEMLLRVLVKQLTEALGERLRVEREGGMFKKSDKIKAVDVTLGSDAYRADINRGQVVATVAHSSGGIRIRSEKVTMDQWVRRLLEALRAEAAHSQTARQALENIVIGGPA
jgi:hypothetical protein